MLEKLSNRFSSLRFIQNKILCSYLMVVSFRIYIRKAFSKFTYEKCHSIITDTLSGAQWYNVFVYQTKFLLNKLSSLVVDCIRIDFHNKNKYEFIDISQYSTGTICKKKVFFFKSNVRRVCVHYSNFCFYYIIDTNRVTLKIDIAPGQNVKYHTSFMLLL